MKKLEKQFYNTPSVRIYEVIQEGVVCQSGDTEQYHDGDEYDDDDFNS
ncbi:MAG: hypothetical protein IKS82_04510 [Bacteroidales bacterium]|nr:hypothetical protein [Bacteroidales bacterium]